MSAKRRMKKMQRQRRNAEKPQSSAQLSDLSLEEQLQVFISLLPSDELASSRQQGIADGQAEFRRSKEYAKLVKTHGRAAAEQILLDVANDIPGG
jgi:hypothetical protein